MRQDFFTYTPQFTLLIAGNHKPSFQSVDEAIRRRLYLIPFLAAISPNERNPNLLEELTAEWPGILQWAIEGCLDWRRHGLTPPPCVTEATKADLEAEDKVTQWLSECFDIGEGLRASRAELASSWQDWCKQAGEKPGRLSLLYQARAARLRRV
jgi:putative DNA primase/helicase